MTERTQQILDVAEEVLERDGISALTMRRLASELGIQAPSLYKHVRSKEEIVAGLQARALRDQAAAFAGLHDTTSLASAYRTWALAHPCLYELLSRHSLDRERLPEGLEAAAAAPLLAVAGHDVDRARALWAFAHGMVDLEIAGRFPPDADLDAAWAAAVDSFMGGSPAPAARAATPHR
jgi:AcrR family transcriptional regulator